MKRNRTGWPMTIKSVLVSLDGNEAHSAALDAAHMVARRFAAHLDVLHVRPDSLTEVPAIGDGMSGRLADAVAGRHAQGADRRALTARAQFAEFCARNGLRAVEEGPTLGGGSASLLERTGRRHAWMMRLGRVHDLLVVGHPSDPADIRHSLTLDALFHTGRPVLVVPTSTPATLGERIAIAWNGSPECARALGGATNFLAQAKQVTILTALSPRTPAEVIPELATYLSRHGVAAAVKEVPHPEGKQHLGGGPLISAAMACHADLLVMGAKAVTGWRKLFLGHATRDVLLSCPIPLLMGH